jgi:Lon protease-like protein
VPLFPLPDVVLFPNVPLPLHVFEPRYRALVAEALDSHRTIGMTLLKPGYQAAYHGCPPIYPLGGAGAIVQHERLADGRYNIVLHGRERVRVIEEQSGAPYRLAKVETLGDAAGDDDSLGQIKQRLIEAFERLMGGTLILEDEVSPPGLVNGLCQQLDLPVVEKLDLLACDSIESRARRLVELLEYHKLERESGRTTGMN